MTDFTGSHPENHDPGSPDQLKIGIFEVIKKIQNNTF
jgi:hypothetical protein